MGKIITKDTVIMHDAQGRPLTPGQSRMATAIMQGARISSEEHMRKAKEAKGKIPMLKSKKTA